jgi:DNA (cytosine-5)-methyltransferase 1
MKNKFNVIDLFSGCGGLSYGFGMANYSVLLGIDIDDISIQTLKLNHPKASVITGDIAKISSKQIVKKINNVNVDVIVGGPPCQGFSLSGPRNLKDPRNKLFMSFVRIVNDLQPKAFVIENVPGLVGLYGGQIKDEIINQFSKMGYSVNYKILIAADYGVPQVRRRVFFVGLRSKTKIFEFPEPSHMKDQHITTRMAISDLPSLEQDLGKTPCLYKNNGRLTNYQKVFRNGSRYLHNHIGTAHTEKTKHIISLVPEGGNYKNLPEKYKTSRNFHVAWTRFHGNKPSPTIDTGHRHHFHYKYNRVPTVRESARIQSFPDKFIFLGNKSQQYAQVGNAVPPLLAEVLAKKLKDYL